MTTDDYLSDISDFECYIPDDDSSNVERQIGETTSYEYSSEEKRVPPCPGMAKGAQDEGQQGPKPLRFDITSIARDPQNAGLNSSAPPALIISHRAENAEVMNVGEEPLLKTYKVKSCLKEFGDKVDGKNFDIMTLYTWNTKVQLQHALEAHMKFAKGLKEQNSIRRRA